MGQKMRAQLGSVLDVGIYEFLKNAKTWKVKILFNRNNPIRAGMWIGNEQDEQTGKITGMKIYPCFALVVV